MTANTRPNFRYAHTQEHQLSKRQREVMRLVADGHTNSEIAERLGISLDGAKWNVSEILGKLGLSTREEIAEFAQSSGGVPRFAAFKWLPASLLKPVPLIAFFAVAAVAVGLLGVMQFTGADDQVDDASAFYLEGLIDSPDDAGSTTRTVVRYWYLNEDTYHIELAEEQPIPGPSLTIRVEDGIVTLIDARAGAFVRGKFADLKPGQRAMLEGALTGQLGPARADSIDAFVARLQGWALDQGSQVNVGDSQEVPLAGGITVTTIEIRPSNPATPDGTERVDTDLTYLVDPATMLIVGLHILAPGGVGGQSRETLSVVQRLELGIDALPAAPKTTDLRQAPIADAPFTDTTLSSAADGGSLGVRGHEFEAPFLSVAYSPAGANLTLARETASAVDGSLVTAELRYLVPPTGGLTLSQRRGTGLIDAFERDLQQSKLDWQRETIQLGTRSVRKWTQVHESFYLWQEGEVFVVVVGAFTGETLDLAFIESLVPGK